MAEEVKKDTEETQGKEGEAPAETKEETVGKVLDVQPKAKEQPKLETVGLDKFLELKKDNKRLAKEMEELRRSIENGASKGEVSSDIRALADKHNIDPEFLKDLASVRGGSETELEERLAARLKPFEEREKQQEIDKAFNKGFTQAIEKMPEYQKIVNQDVIKSLSLDPRNSEKTFSQLIEETYGNALGGKRTIESTRPRGGKEPEVIDFDRTRKDPEYLREVLADPTSKKKYNEGLTDRLSNYL